MIPLTLEHIRIATNGKLINADPSALIQSICTDTRKIEPGCLFIALTGEYHDGHHHVESAAKGGAIAAMVHDDCLAHLPMLKVVDTRQAMGRLGAYIRRELKGTVIAVAGSNGKTGTKNLIRSALNTARTGTISPKSFNNDIGVPLAIFAADPNDDYLVLELGTNHSGEILNLTSIAQPDIAIITSIGAEHLEFLVDINGVIQENAQIITALNPHGLLLINGDYPLLSVSETTPKKGDKPALSRSSKAGFRPGCPLQRVVELPQSFDCHCPLKRAARSVSLGFETEQDKPLISAVSGYPGRVVTFGFESHNDFYPTDIECTLEGVRFRLDGMPVFVPQLGRHTAVNAIAAIVVGRYFGVSDAEIIAGLATAVGPEMRMQLQTAGSIKILNDAYNANPHSMQAGLETLRDMKSSGRKIAILGDMKELGEAADRYHREIGEFSAECDLDHLVCVGDKAKLIAEVARAKKVSVEYYATASDCVANISSIVREHDLVLLKGSRSMKLETVANAIMNLAAIAGVQREVAARMKKVIAQPPRAKV